MFSRVSLVGNISTSIIIQTLKHGLRWRRKPKHHDIRTRSEHFIVCNNSFVLGSTKSSIDHEVLTALAYVVVRFMSMSLVKIKALFSDISISSRSIRKQSMIYPLGLVTTKQR